MTDETPPAASSALYIVCLLDVLGFEATLNRLGLPSLQSKYAALVAYVKQQTGGIDIVPTPGGHVAVGWLVLGNAYFSDTLLFWAQYSQLALPSFTHLVAEALCFGLETELPLRGGVAVGEAILERDAGIFLGKPLVEVARTERAQEWIGASFGPSFQDPRFNQGFHLHTLLPYKSHYKDPAGPYSTGMAVDWPRHWRESRKSDPRPIVRRLDRDPDFTEYYQKSLVFIEFSETNHDWFRKGGQLAYG
jgi:hypothetical protein